MPAGELVERGRERHRPGVVVEGVHRLPPARAGESLGLLGHEPGAGGDHERVVEQRRPVRQPDPRGFSVDVVDRAAVVLDPPAQLPRPRPDEVFRLGETERHEQQTRLVDMLVVLVHHGDPDLLAQSAPQPVRRQCPAGSAAENHDVLAHRSSLEAACGPG